MTSSLISKSKSNGKENKTIFSIEVKTVLKFSKCDQKYDFLSAFISFGSQTSPYIISQ